jgi:hypothetical protein
MTYNYPEIPTADEVWIGLFVFACFMLILFLHASIKPARETASQLGNKYIAFSLISLVTTAGLLLFALNSETNRELFLKLTLVQGLVGVATFILGLSLLRK